MIQHYELTVQKELLPVPFSVVQLALSRLFVDLHARFQRVSTYLTREGGGDHDTEQVWRIDGATLQVFGQGVFRLDLGPVAVMARVLL